jgi:uncharacterized protein DUF6064
MSMPFTKEQFFDVFARYNGAVWPAQIALTLLALTAILLLYRAGPWDSRFISIILSILWIWMAVAYHLLFFVQINPAAWLFGTISLIGGLWFIWLGVIRAKLRFCGRRDVTGYLGCLLIGFGLLVYPLLSFLAGHRYPAMPTFGLPCPTTIFTLGLLLFVVPPIPKSVFVVPLIWATIGSIAAFQLSVPQDMGLLVAALIAAVLVWSTVPVTSRKNSGLQQR